MTVSDSAYVSHDETAGGMRRNPIRYFEDGKHRQRIVRRYGTGQGERYLFLGYDYCDYNIFEPSQEAIHEHGLTSG